MHDIVIIGAGPAGLTAALYALRAEKTVLVLEKETFGGQITYSPRVENYPGFMQMSGNEFAEKLMDQVLAHGGDIEMDTVTGITGTDGDFTVQTESGSYPAASVIIAAGSKHRRLGLDNEEAFTGEGISYCAVCDGAFYKGRDVAVIGGGNTALQEAVLLSEGCRKVYIVQNLAFLTGEQKLVRLLQAKDNVEIICSSVVTGLVGTNALQGIVIENEDNKSSTTLTVDGVFIAVGQQPENEPFRQVVALDENGYITAGESCRPEGTSKGIFVAGDCRTKAVRQVTTAVADGAVAALSACRFVDALRADA